MASMIDIRYKKQQSYASIADKEAAIKSYSPNNWEIDINYPLIAKGNIIEGIKARA